MNFFRLRALNTFLLFCAGVLLGFLLKEKFRPASAAQREPAPYRPAYEAAPRRPAPAQDDENLTDEPYLAPDEEVPAPEKPAVAQAGRQGAVLETAAPAAPRGAALKGEEEDFFARPAAYEGRDLEMNLQMISARRAAAGWRLNLVHTGSGSGTGYLYVDDAGVLGDKPDLRIGYVYRVRFSCGAGKTDAGNTLLDLAPTGAKADWATGLSAVE